MSARLSVVAAVLAVFVVLGAVLLIAGGPILTNDLWWHLGMGEVYAREGPWLAADPLLHTAHADGPVQHEWLFGVLVHGIVASGGFSALRAAHAAAVVGIAWLAYGILRRATRSTQLACLGVVVFLALSWWRLIQARPDLASIAAVLVGYRLLLEGDAPISRARMIGYALLMAVWANLHSLFAIAFPLGLAALGALAVQILLARRSASAPTHALELRARRARGIGLGLLAGFAASLLNPRGIEQHWTFFRSSSSAAIWRVTDEWRAFNPFHWDAQHESPGLLAWSLADAVLLIFAIVALRAGLVWWKEPGTDARRSFDPLLYALGAASVVAMLASVRFLWLGFFPLLALLSSAAQWESQSASRSEESTGRSGWLAAGAAVAIAGLFPFAPSYRATLSTQPSGLGAYFETPYQAHKFAVPGVQFLLDTGLEGRLFNKYGAGGFLGYWLSPKLLTFVDGRVEHYPVQVFDEYMRIVKRAKGDTDVSSLLDARGVDVFVGFGFPNVAPRHGLRFTGEHLRGHADWILVSRSTLHGIWLRRGDRNARNLERVVAYYARVGVSFDPVRGLEPAQILVAPSRSEMDWAVETRLVPSGYPATRARAEGADREAKLMLLPQLAIAHALAGDYGGQVALDRQLLSLDKSHRGALRRLTYGLLRIGSSESIAEAQILANTLARVAPDDARTALVSRVARRFGIWQMKARRSPGTPAPAELLDRFPLLEVREQARILDDQRLLRVRSRSGAGT